MKHIKLYESFLLEETSVKTEVPEDMDNTNDPLTKRFFKWLKDNKITNGMYDQNQKSPEKIDLYVPADEFGGEAGGWVKAGTTKQPKALPKMKNGKPKPFGSWQFNGENIKFM